MLHLYSLCTFPVPGPVQGLVVVSVMERKLNISWEEPAEPNDYTLNYTVTITDISTGTELSRTVVLDMNKPTTLTDILGMFNHKDVVINVLRLFIPVKGIPYNVTVFATNGRGSGSTVSKISYAEEDGKYYNLTLLYKLKILQFRGLREI